MGVKLRLLLLDESEHIRKQTATDVQPNDTEGQEDDVRGHECLSRTFSSGKSSETRVLTITGLTKRLYRDTRSGAQGT